MRRQALSRNRKCLNKFNWPAREHSVALCSDHVQSFCLSSVVYVQGAVGVSGGGDVRDRHMVHVLLEVLLSDGLVVKSHDEELFLNPLALFSESPLYGQHHLDFHPHSTNCCPRCGCKSSQV